MKLVIKISLEPKNSMLSLKIDFISISQIYQILGILKHFKLVQPSKMKSSLPLICFKDFPRLIRDNKVSSDWLT